MYFIFLLSIHAVLCIVLIGLVLLQQGKGADAGATFGGGGGNTVFGAAGAADFITKLTTTLAIGFMVTSILLIRGYQHGGGAVLTSKAPDVLGGSVMEEVGEAVPAAEEPAEKGAQPVEEAPEDGAAEQVADDAAAPAPVVEEGEAVVDAAETAVKKEVSEEVENAEAVAEKVAVDANTKEEVDTSSGKK